MYLDRNMSPKLKFFFLKAEDADSALTTALAAIESAARERLPALGRVLDARWIASQVQTVTPSARVLVAVHKSVSVLQMTDSYVLV